MGWENYVAGFTAFHDRIRGVAIENMDACKVIRLYDSPETLHYVDPPYVLSTRKGPRYRHELSDNQHAELAELLHSVNGAVIVSGYSCPLYERLFRGWTRHDRRNYNSVRQACTESIWVCPKASSKTRWGIPLAI